LIVKKGKRTVRNLSKSFLQKGKFQMKKKYQRPLEYETVSILSFNLSISMIIKLAYILIIRN